MRRALIILGCTLAALVAYAATQSQYFSGDVIVAGQVRDPGGTNYLKDAPLVATNYVRSNGVWVPMPGTGGGISDAPSDTYLYGRYNATWLRLDDAGYAQHLSSPGVPWISFEGSWSDGRDFFSQTGHVHSGSDITTGTVIPARLGSGTLSATNVLFGDGVWGPMDWDWIDGKPSTFPPDTHSHAWGDITGKPDVSTNGHTHAASDVVSGVLATARLGTGTASSSVFLRGDGSWATVTVDPGNTNGITDAPNDGTFYGRKSAGWVQPTVADVDGLQADLDDRVLYDDLADLAVGNLTISGSTTMTGLGSDITSGTGYKFLVHDSSGNVAKKVSTSFALSYIGAAASAHGHDWADITGEPSFVETSRTITGANSITGGGDLSANRTLSLDNDESSPAASKYYGTSGAGTRGWHALAGSHTHTDLANFVFLTVSAVTNSNQDTTFRSVLGTVKTGYSNTLEAASLSSGSVIKIEAAGVFVGDDGHNPDVELRIGSSYKLTFSVTEPQSTGPTEGTPWNLVAWITVTASGSSATVNANGWMDYADNTGGSAMNYAPSPLSRSKAFVSGTLNTTAANTVDLVYRGNDALADSFSCTHFILQQF